MVFQFTALHFTLGGIERSNQGHWVFIQLHWAMYHRPCIIRQRSSQAERPLVLETQISSHLRTNSLPQDI